MIPKCTIIIPTYNRPKYLRRILSYYNGFEENYNIIVADSSSNENKKLNKKSVLIFSNLEIQYIDKYLSKIEPSHKITDVLNYINTKYSVLCADDDFIIPKGINRAVNFLENNEDFSVAQGHYIYFYLKNEDKREQKLCWASSIYLDKSITFPEAESRLAFHLSNYQLPTFYAVHRTELLKMIFKDTVKFTDDDRFGELLPSMLTLIYGKMKHMDVLYGAREIIIDSGGRTSKNLNNFIKNGTYEKKYTKFRECLAKALVSEEDISKEKAQKLIDKAMNQYLGSSMFKLKLRAGLIAGLKRINGLYALLKKFYFVYRRFKTSKKKISVLDKIPAIEYDNKENPYYEDFIRIKESVEKGIME